MFYKPLVPYLMSLAVLFGPTSVQAITTVYTDEATYLAALTGLSFVSTVQESFEDDSLWPRFLSSAPNVSNLGITWSPLAATAGITTSDADSHDGSFQMFAVEGLSHPFPDGFSLTAGSFNLYGVGGWFKGNNTKLGFSVDGDSTRVNFTGAEATVFDWKFLGFIEDDINAGFSSVEVISTDEGGDSRIFFSDDFTLAGQATVVPLPASLPLFGTGLMAMLGLLGRRRAKST
jgi:hypothetical protein